MAVMTIAVTGCGNGLVTGSEECDDGNDVSSDGCADGTRFARCSDGIRGPGEECDDGVYGARTPVRMAALWLVAVMESMVQRRIR